MMFSDTYRQYLDVFHEALNRFVKNLSCEPPVLKDSMTYSLQLGGKRFRPVLMLAVADLLGVPQKEIMPFALALELVHTYTLIHDDLPAMDNDDFRRGKPSNHKVFGEGNAVLAGDALLNTAYEMLLKECLLGKNQVQATRYFALCAGINGVIGGQSADLLFSANEDFSEDDLLFIYENKTAKLIKAATVIPAILHGGKYMIELENFGGLLGNLFQLTDDILDEESNFEELGKSIGKDKEQDKLTAVKLYGLPGCKVRAELMASECDQLLEGLPFDTSFLHALVEFVKERKK